MTGTIWSNPYQAILLIGISTIALLLLGKAIISSLSGLAKIISTLIDEFSGKAPAPRAAAFNILLIVILTALAFLSISPSLLSQLGFAETGSSLLYCVIIIFLLCATGIWSGHFIHQCDIESNAYKDVPKTKSKAKGKEKDSL